MEKRNWILDLQDLLSDADFGPLLSRQATATVSVHAAATYLPRSKTPYLKCCHGFAPRALHWSPAPRRRRDSELRSTLPWESTSVGLMEHLMDGEELAQQVLSPHQAIFLL
jgi:hypothetical protein